MNENINVLDELNKGACMGIDAINFIIEKIENQDFKSSLVVQSQKYKNISDKINKIYKKYNKDDSPHETSAMNKAMTWSGIEMKTIVNHSDSKIAELLLKGTNMGIIEGRKILNNKNMDNEIRKIAEEYVLMQEDSVENLKKYL